MSLQFARTEQLLGDRFRRLAKAQVTVCGLGAVGSYAVEALARAGIGQLRIVDFDIVNMSNINRQLFALHSTVGTEKTTVARDRIRDINPACNVDVRHCFIGSDTVESLLDPPPDVLVDAIDSVASKVILMKAASERSIPLVSSMGAAGRIDPTRIRVVDLDETHGCPLARIIRKRLHRHGIYRGIRCIYSTERAQNKRPVPPSAREEPANTRGRVRIPIGSASWVTGAFGCAAAGEAVRIILSKFTETEGE